jgi:hypothetical protein
VEEGAPLGTRTYDVPARGGRCLPESEA